MEDNSGTAPLKITINGQEYDPADAQDLIETGRKTRDYETQWNTKLDNVWPEYGRSREQIKSLQAEIDEYKKKAVEGNATQQDKSDAQAAATQLGVKLEDLDKAGYIKKDSLDSLLEEKLLKRDQAKQATEAVLEEADKLEGDLNGSDGRPKFSKRLVLAYASSYQKGSLMEAYEEMYADELKAWKEAQIEKEKRSSLKTQGGGGIKQPKTPRINDSNFKESLSEALYGNKE